jgi:hypothetical protein
MPNVISNDRGAKYSISLQTGPGRLKFVPSHRSVESYAVPSLSWKCEIDCAFVGTFKRERVGSDSFIAPV